MKRIVYLINNVGFFVSHRLPLAEEAIDNEIETFLISGLPGSQVIEEKALNQISKHNITHFTVPFSAQGINPFKETFNLFKIVKLLRQIKPNLLHAASPKGILLASLANLLIGSELLILSISGMGFLYAADSRNIVIRVIRVLFISLLFCSINLRKTKIIVQNKDDYKFWNRIISSKRSSIEIIPGSGVNIKEYEGISPDKNSKVILFPSRLLIEKGILDFVKAAEIILNKGYKWKFVVAGTADYESPGSISEEEIAEWTNQGIIEWLGHQNNMPQIYQQSSIVCLPSYREGLPKSLLEAAAAGLPIITTDVVGCREAIIHNQTGLLVPHKRPEKLANAIQKLIENPDIRYQYGKNGKKLAIEKFCLNKIKRSFKEIYLKGINPD